MDLPTYLGDLVRNRDAWAEHVGVVRDWNAHVDAGERAAGADELFDFLLNHIPNPASAD